MTFAVCKACGAGAERDQRIFDALGVTVVSGPSKTRARRGERKAEMKRDDAMRAKLRALAEVHHKATKLT
jgi:hypothetical protein